MVLYEIYSHPIVKRYKASIFSKATFFQVVTFILTVICPLLIAYRSQGFWVKTSTYKEQPLVNYKHQYLIHLHSNTADQYFVWSSFPGFNNVEQDHLRIGYIQSHQTDYNNDGKPDQFQFQARVPLNAGETVYSAKLFLIFDYQLKFYSRFQMESLISVDYGSVMPSAEIKVVGDMKLVQKIPLRYHGIDHRFNVAIVNGSKLDADSYLYNRILSEYFSRNVTCKLDPANVYWTHGPAGVLGEFKINIVVNYVEDTLEYKTGFWELIKWAWIQYLSILLIFIFIFKRIRSFVFQNRLVYAVPVEIGHQNARSFG